MEAINNITQDFGTLYHPKSALVFYKIKGNNTDVFVERKKVLRSAGIRRTQKFKNS